MQYRLISSVAPGTIVKYLRFWYFVGIYQSPTPATSRGLEMIGSQILRLEQPSSLPDHRMGVWGGR